MPNPESDGLIGVSYPQDIREINQHEGVRVGLNSAGNVQSNCSNALDPTALNKTAGTDGQIVDLRGVISDLGTHLQCCTDSDNVIVSFVVF